MAWQRDVKLISQFQMIEVWSDPEIGALALLLNKELQFFVPGEYVYHEALAVVPMLYAPDNAKVCILGGGDGLAVREVLKFVPEKVIVCDIDPEITGLCSQHERIKEVNKNSLSHEKCTVVNFDGPSFIMANKGWDVVICDYPDPMSTAMDRLYSVEHYSDIYNALEAKGVVVVQSSSANVPVTVAQVAANLAEAGFKVAPYWASTFWGRHGFVLGMKGQVRGATSKLEGKELFYLTEKLVKAMFVWEKGAQAAFESAKSGSVFQASVLNTGLCKRFYPFKEE